MFILNRQHSSIQLRVLRGFVVNPKVYPAVAKRLYRADDVAGGLQALCYTGSRRNFCFQLFAVTRH